MTVKQRILALKLFKAQQKNPELTSKLGMTVRIDSKDPQRNIPSEKTDIPYANKP